MSLRSRPTSPAPRRLAKQFSPPRFKVLYRLWLRYGTDVLWNTYSALLVEKFDRDLASVECIVLSRQYVHLTHLVGVA